MSVSDNVYQSAVKGRSDFRKALKEARAKILQLEGEIEIAVRYLKEGKARFSPGTTNSFVDDFIERHSAKTTCDDHEVKELTRCQSKKE